MRKKNKKNKKNKYSMTVEENIYYAKRNLVDSMWKSANLEGIVVTYPQIEMIYDELAMLLTI